jgi:26S proteasome regulatory subunit N5
MSKPIQTQQIIHPFRTQVLHDAGDVKGLQEQITMLAKRRGQLKQAVQDMVRQCMGYADAMPDPPQREEVVRTLLSLTEGKIYVEIERARLTRQLAAMKEQQGQIAEAAEILQEVAVETFGAMHKTEKIAYILEQVRLCLDRSDFVRAQILSRKISPRAFAAPIGAKKGEATGEVGIEGTAVEAPALGTPSLEQLKLQYYALMVRYHAHEKDYLEMCRSYRAVLDTPGVKDDAMVYDDFLRKAAWYAVLAPRTSDQQTLLAATASDPRMDDLPLYRSLLSKFSGKEVLWWRSLLGELGDEMEAQTDVFGGEAGKQRREGLRSRVVEHNVHIIAKYYSRLSVDRLAQMLDMDAMEAEQRLCDMVTGQGLAAKVDRPSGIVSFGARRGPGEALNAWSGNISRLLGLVEATCQQIQKESQVHKVELNTTS